jgi:hypothetical protein
MGRLAHRRGRAHASGVVLTLDDRRLVKGMLARGDRQHDIASWFGVNPGRIAEIATGFAFANVEAPQMANLPPPGPYLSGRVASAALAALAEARAALAQAETNIRSL